MLYLINQVRHILSLLQADRFLLKRISPICVRILPIFDFVHINFAKHLNIIVCAYYSFKISGSFHVEVATEIVERRLD